MLIPAPWVECVQCDLKPGIGKVAWKSSPAAALYSFYFGLVFFGRCEPWLVTVLLPGLWTADTTAAGLPGWLPAGSLPPPRTALCEVQECIVSEV